MKKRSPLTYLSLAAACLVLLAACTPSQEISEEQVALAVAQTQVAMTQTALAAVGSGEELPDVKTEAPPPGSIPTATLTLVPSLTLTPTVTFTPTITLTPTLEKPMVSVSVNTNCRTGPGKIYAINGALLVNEEAEVVGKSPDGEYWIIKNPDRAGECWLWGYYATVKGPTDALPVITPPPTPTPEFSWAGSWTAYTNLFSGVMQTYNMTVSVNGKTFSGVVDLSGWDDATLTGTLSDDFLSVSGTWTSPTNNGTFKFFALGLLQFQGNGNDGAVWAWCGSRSSAGEPDPCLKQ